MDQGVSKMMHEMKFATCLGRIQCKLLDGRVIELPIYLGLLKHPRAGELSILLTNPDVARKYTVEALRRAPWNLLREFPEMWLRECIVTSGVRASRQKALEFLLS
jgi:hypothetical protein